MMMVLVVVVVGGKYSRVENALSQCVRSFVNLFIHSFVQRVALCCCCWYCFYCYQINANNTYCLQWHTPATPLFTTFFRYKIANAHATVTVRFDIIVIFFYFGLETNKKLCEKVKLRGLLLLVWRWWPIFSSFFTHYFRLFLSPSDPQ